MLDFCSIEYVPKYRAATQVRMTFHAIQTKDLMIRGGEFYAMWDEAAGMWTTNYFRAIQILDGYLVQHWNENPQLAESGAVLCKIEDTKNRVIRDWNDFIKKDMPSNWFEELDTQIAFANTPVDKSSLVSKRLGYSIADGDYSGWDELVGVLYEPFERLKLEWIIGAVISGDSKKIQKFGVLYGEPGSGKSTVLNIIQSMFDGYWASFESRTLGSRSDSFALEPFKDNPLLGIEHDGDLSGIETNTRLNSIASHEPMVINTKHKALYTIRLNTFLLIGTNNYVKISDAKSGILRRLIDIYPSNRLVPLNRYNELIRKINFEYGAIAAHCLTVYNENKRLFDNYIAENMVSESNAFYNFVQENYDLFKQQDSTTVAQAWKLYVAFTDDAKIAYRLDRVRFKNELKTYFDRFYERKHFPDGTFMRNYYQGFRRSKFHNQVGAEEAEVDKEQFESNITESVEWLRMKQQTSAFDIMARDYPAQYATQKGSPTKRWAEVETTLKDISTDQLHYVRVPQEHIVIDFDADDLATNLENASAFPPTYAELSRSGKRIHLHYIYDGDPTKLATTFDYKIEIKVYTGFAALRRMLTKCNGLEVAHISSGLPLKGDKAVINTEVLANERHLRALIMKGLNRDVWPNTRPSIDYIKMLLEKAYNQEGFVYDVTDMRQAVLTFASESTNQAEYCYSVAANLPYKSKQVAADLPFTDENPIVIYDCEVFQNLFVVCWKERGPDKRVVKMINPTPLDIETLVDSARLVGFNCKRYDNIILYARIQGASEMDLYKLTQRIINSTKDKSRFEQDYMLNQNAKNLSYFDIFDMLNGDHRKGLKKWEIDLRIHHKECPFPWDKPVDEKDWVDVTNYCANDVIATEAVLDAILDNDYKSREILSTVADLPINSSTNELTAKIIFGDDKKPQSQFNWRDLSEPVIWLPDRSKEFLSTHTTLPLKFRPWDGSGESLLPYFPGYDFDNGRSLYRGEIVGEGGYVYAEPGIHYNVALLDVASMHPTSAVDEILFGYDYTQRFYDLLQTRLHVKHKEFDAAAQLFDGRMAPFLQDPSEAKKLSQALKIPINMVYGNTSAQFENKFRDPNNIDNIVAKRGALFMIDLKNAVQSRGFQVAHIKTDSIKIPNATPEIIDYVMGFGKYYGYTFEHEATYERMCLVNDAVYIAKYHTPEWCKEKYGYVPDKCEEHGGEWTATGKQFSVPYVYKTLFTHEPIDFDDVCETKSVTNGAAIYLDMNETMPDVSEIEKEYDKALKKQKKCAEEGVIVPAKTQAILAEAPDLIKKGHDLQFVGAVGLFCPMLPGSGGGIMLRVDGDKIGAVSGTKGYRWLEAEMVVGAGVEDRIDYGYYEALVQGAKDAISQYGSFDEFVNQSKGD